MPEMKKNWIILGISLIIITAFVTGCITINPQSSPGLTVATPLVTTLPTIVPTAQTTEIIPTTIITTTPIPTEKPHSNYMYQVHRTNPSGGLSINTYEYYEPGFVCTNPEIANINYKNGTFSVDRNLDNNAWEKERAGWIGIWCENKY